MEEINRDEYEKYSKIIRGEMSSNGGKITARKLKEKMIKWTPEKRSQYFKDIRNGKSVRHYFK